MFINILILISLFFNYFQILELIKTYKNVSHKIYLISYASLNILMIIFGYLKVSFLNNIAIAYFNFSLFYCLIGIIILLLNLIPNFFDKFKKSLEYIKIFLTVIIVVLTLTLTNSIKIIEYEIKTDKKIPDLNLVLISDLYLGYLNNEEKINGIVGKINTLNPDIVIITGNLFTKYIDDTKISDALKSIKAEYGIFAILGDNEKKMNDKLFTFYKECGIIFLEDSTVEFDRISIVGRKNSFLENTSEIDELLKFLTAGNFKIFLNQDSKNVNEITDQEIDLVLSNNNFFSFSKRYRDINNTKIITTKGLYEKTPIRFRRPEIANIKLTYQEN